MFTRMTGALRHRHDRDTRLQGFESPQSIFAREEEVADSFLSHRKDSRCKSGRGCQFRAIDVAATSLPSK